MEELDVTHTDTSVKFAFLYICLFASRGSPKHIYYICSVFECWILL